MQTVRFLTERADGGYMQWCVTNQKKVFFEFMQYVLDSCRDPEMYLILDESNSKVIKLTDAAKQFGMRKRTPEERFSGVRTYSMKEVIHETDNI